MSTVLITGSSGLVGSESVSFFAKLGWDVVGVDNNMREYFFGKDGSTVRRRDQLLAAHKNFTHHEHDIRAINEIKRLFKKYRFDLVIHAAAQPSHDWAVREPKTDFTINANGTLNLLEQFRKHSPRGVFIFTSTNKVYGDNPNSLPLIEKNTRYEIDPKHPFARGIDETMSVDATKHSLFGVSKLAADALVQEYGRYFGLQTIVFRGGCLTGPMHAGAQLHGFLSYLTKCILTGTPYTIFGYKGKQVRDNIHAHDLVNAFFHVAKNPKAGEVYNIGGSRHSNISLLEAVSYIEKKTGKKAKISYEQTARSGDHIWYISNVNKFKSHYPGWNYTYTIEEIMDDIINYQMSKS